MPLIIFINWNLSICIFDYKGGWCWIQVVTSNSFPLNAFFLKKSIDKPGKMSIIKSVRGTNIAGLCKGSTADSDSVCRGSNPLSPANKKQPFVYRQKAAFCTMCSLTETIGALRAWCLLRKWCALRRVRGTHHITSAESRYITMPQGITSRIAEQSTSLYEQRNLC